MTAPTDLRVRAERELCEDLRIRVVHDGERSWHLQRLNAAGVVVSVRPTERAVYTLFTEAVRGRVALLERWMKETDGK